MVPQKRVISPSLVLDSVQTDRFKTETLSINIALPMLKEQTPLYTLAMSVLKRGTEKYPTQQAINRRLDELYATGISIRAERYGSTVLLGFSAEMLSDLYTDQAVDVFDGALDIMIQMLFHPRMDEAGKLLSCYVESEKENMCDSIEAQIHNPRTYAASRCRELMYEGDDYGVSLFGSVEQIRAVSVDQVSAAWRKLISSYDFRVFYVGSKNADEVERRIRMRLLSYLPCGFAHSLPITDCSAKVGEIRRYEEKKELSQGNLVMGFRTGIHVCSSEFYSMLVFLEIYGASPVSKLFMNVRERLGLCYYCSASYDIYKGAMFVSSGVEPGTEGTAEAEILNQLEQMKSGQISDAEFGAAVKSLMGSYRAIVDLPSTLEAFYTGRDLFGVDCTVDEFMENLSQVTVEDVIAVAHKITLDTVYFLCGEQNGEEDEDDFDDLA